MYNIFVCNNCINNDECLSKSSKKTKSFNNTDMPANLTKYLVPGVRNGKIYLVPNDSYDQFYLAVKGLVIHNTTGKSYHLFIFHNNVHY